MCRPQDFTFPDDDEGPPSFPLSTVATSEVTNNSIQITTPTTEENASTTRIPPRDPGNRIVFIIPPNCDCQFTRQYSPVCGTDGQTYGNIGVLQCNRLCGRQVEVFLDRSCTSNNG